MLILTRRKSEKVIIVGPDGTRIVVTVLDLERGKARLGFEAPRDVFVDREEIALLRQAEKQAPQE